MTNDQSATRSRLKPNRGNLDVVPEVGLSTLINLAVNARDAMPDGGVIVVETENWIVESHQRFADQQKGFEAGRYVRMLFSDTGSGMSAETRGRIFEPFFTTKEVGKGTGLGLSTVYGILQNCGGQISVYSEPGQGTTFAIYFLQCQEEAAAANPDEGGVKPGTETVLLVEDEPSLRSLAVSILRSSGYRVLEASCGEEAFALSTAEKSPIQMLLTDMVMPGTNGQKLAAMIKGHRPGLKVIFMSGYSEHTILEKMRPEETRSFIQKPFTPAQLLRKMREVLDGGQG